MPHHKIIGVAKRYGHQLLQSHQWMRHGIDDLGGEKTKSNVTGERERKDHIR